ncbi:CRPV-056 [Crowpox virus]|nr:CRPV-056 [Crowpox virus]
MLIDNNKTRFVIEIGNSFTRTGRYEFYLILKYTEKYYDVNKDYMMMKLLKRYLKTN